MSHWTVSSFWASRFAFLGGPATGFITLAMQKTTYQQSIPNGTQVQFNATRHHLYLFGDAAKDAQEHNGQRATVLCLACASILGNTNYEYYDLKFADGCILQAVSGTHIYKA